IEGDWDGDGDLDLAVTNDASNDVTILVNTTILADVEEAGGSIPSEFHLSQNFPNPFNPTTTIQYSIPSAGFVSLRVYSILGLEVTILVNEMKSPGRYATIWDASEM